MIVCVRSEVEPPVAAKESKEFFVSAPTGPFKVPGSGLGGSKVVTMSRLTVGLNLTDSWTVLTVSTETLIVASRSLGSAEKVLAFKAIMLDTFVFLYSI